MRLTDRQRRILEHIISNDGDISACRAFAPSVRLGRGRWQVQMLALQRKGAVTRHTDRATGRYVYTVTDAARAAL